MEMQRVKVLSLVHHDFEDLELWYPIYRLREEGASVHLAGEKEKETYIGKYGVPAISDFSFSQIDPRDYDALLVPGGWAPDKLRRFKEVIEIVKHMDDHQKPIGQICHAGWVLISANILKGKRVTSTPGIKDDMVNAGGVWEDKGVVIDGHLVSSQRPPDLPIYMKEFVNVLKNKFKK